MPPNPTELLSEQVQLLQGIQAELKQLTAQEANTADNVARLHQTVAALNAQVELAEQERGRTRARSSSVRLIDVNLPISSMVVVIVKWAVATLIASPFLAILFGILAFLLSLLFRNSIRLF